MSELPAWIEAYYDIPYKEMGRDRSGADCYGLVRLILIERFHVVIPSYQSLYDDIHKDRIAISEQILTGTKVWPWQTIPKEEARLGDCIVFRIAGLPLHCGLMVTATECLNIKKGAEVCLDDINGPLWGNRFEGLYRHEDLRGSIPR